MLTYRLYFLGADGHFVGAEPFECGGDKEAIELARAETGDRSSELWQEARMVTAIRPQPGQAPPLKSPG